MQFDKRTVAQRRQARDEEEGRLSAAFEDCRQKEHTVADQFLHPRHSMLYPAYVILRDALQAIRAQCSKKYVALTTYRKKMRHEENNAEPKARARRIEGNEMNMPHVTKDPTPKPDDAPQPPLYNPGTSADTDRAQTPPLPTLPPTNEELKPGDRVMGVEDSGKPTWDFGTVEQANEDDAVVKWDRDGRRKLHQESLQKI